VTAYCKWVMRCSYCKTAITVECAQPCQETHNTMQKMEAHKTGYLNEKAYKYVYFKWPVDNVKLQS
jgi:hypothetical protein